MAHGGDKGAAARELAQSFGIIPVNGAGPYPRQPPPRAPKASDWQPMVPPPDGTAPPPESAFSGFDSVSKYTNTNDRVTHYVRRLEARNRRNKVFIPLTYGALDGVQ